MRPPPQISFEQHWNTCTDLLKEQLKDLSHSPSNYEQVVRGMKYLHHQLAHICLNTYDQQSTPDKSHIEAVQVAILECARFINDNPSCCREAVESMVVILRFMREIYPAKTLNQSLRRQISELEKYEAPDAKHYIDRIIPQYLPIRMPDSLKTPNARIYAIRWRGATSLLELRATSLRDHPRWHRQIANEIKKLLNEAIEIKMGALAEAMTVGAPHQELLCIADHYTLYIIIVQTQMRALSQDSEKAEWVASIMIEYLNSLDLHSGDFMPSWSDDDFV